MGELEAIDTSGQALERLWRIEHERGELFFLRGYGCSGPVASATMNLVRSGTVGLYDLADDSGMRNLPGTRLGYRITLSPALGLLLSLEGPGIASALTISRPPWPWPAPANAATRIGRFSWTKRVWGRCSSWH